MAIEFYNQPHTKEKKTKQNTTCWLIFKKKIVGNKKKCTHTQVMYKRMKKRLGVWVCDHYKVNDTDDDSCGGGDDTKLFH